MEKTKIYVVYNLYMPTNEIKIDNVAFTDIEKATDYIESKMTEKEVLNNRKAKDRKLQHQYEFITDNTIYYWKEIALE